MVVWWQRTAATAVVGHEMQSEREAAEEGIDTGRGSEGSRGVRGCTREGQGEAASRRWPGPRARVRGTRPPAYWQEVEDDREEPWWVGLALPSWAATVPGQVGFAR